LLDSVHEDLVAVLRVASEVVSGARDNQQIIFIDNH
jgi:hypothetical protein